MSLHEPTFFARQKLQTCGTWAILAWSLSDYPWAGCKSGCLAHISAPSCLIATAMSLQTGQNLFSKLRIFASARIVWQAP